MTAAQLKASILDQAIRGKLVPQDPKDEPAEKLLERIREAKAQGEQTKGRARRSATAAPQPITDDEKPFDLPKGWVWIRVGELFTTLGGIWTGAKKPLERIAIIRATNFTKDCELNFEKIVRIDVETKKLQSRVLEAGDFIIEKSGGGENLPVGRVVMFKGSNEKCTFCNFTTMLRPIAKGHVLGDYLHLCFKHIYVSGQTIPLQNNTTNLRNLDLQRYLLLPIPLPPLAEQKRIVAKVEELLPLVEKYGAAYERKRKLIADLPEKLRKSILQEAIQGKLVPQDPKDEPAEKLLERIYKSRVEVEKCRNGRAGGGRGATRPTAGRGTRPACPPITDEEKPFDLPKGWSWCRLGEIANKVGAGSTPLGGCKVYVQTGVKFLREQNVHDAGLNLDNVALIARATHVSMAGSCVRAKDILINITGASIGRNSLVPDDFDEANVNQHVLIVRLTDPELRQYIHQWLMSPMAYLQMLGQQKGDKPGLSAERVKGFLIPLPPLAEQKRIVAKVEELLADVEQLKKVVK